MTAPTRALPAGFVMLSCPTCKGSGAGWDDGVTLLESAATGKPMRTGTETDCAPCGGSGYFGRYWIRQEPAAAWTVTVTDERTGTVHVRHLNTGPDGRHYASTVAHSLLAHIYMDDRADEEATPLWSAVLDLVAAVAETAHRVEAHDRRYGLKVDVRPTDPAHPIND